MGNKREKDPQEDLLSRAARKAEEAVLQDGLSVEEHPGQTNQSSWDDGNVMSFGEVELETGPSTAPTKKDSSLPPRPDELLENLDLHVPLASRDPEVAEPNKVAQKRIAQPMARPAGPKSRPKRRINTTEIPTKPSRTRWWKPALLLVCLIAAFAAVILGFNYWNESQEQKRRDELKLLDQQSRDALMDSAVKQRKFDP